jgi:hypothetical protein
VIIIKVNAQWQQTNCPIMSINCLSIKGSGIFTGTNGNGAYLSLNGGSSWTAINHNLASTDVLSFVIKGDTIFTGTENGVFWSPDNGTNWTAANVGLPTDPYVYALVISENNIFAGIAFGGGVYLSSNNGSTWATVNTGLADTMVTSLIINGSSIFTGTFGGGVYLSSNNGSSWVAVNTGLGNDTVWSFATKGDTIFAGTYNGVYLSSDNGSSWESAGLSDEYITSFVISGSDIFAGTFGGGVYLSSDNGGSWTTVNTGLSDNATYIYALAISDDTIFAGTDAAGVWKQSLSQVTGIKEIDDNRSNFSIYPNPVNDYIIINTNDIDKKDFEIFDSFGNLVFKNRIIDQKQKIGLSLLSGMYLCRFNDFNTKPQKFIVVK